MNISSSLMVSLRIDDFLVLFNRTLATHINVLRLCSKNMFAVVQIIYQMIFTTVNKILIL